jgi:hypothetical protein
LQKSFHLYHADKIELKKISSPSENKKYATAQSTTSKTVKLNNGNGLQGRTDRTPAGNSRLPQWGLMWLNQVQCFYQSLCLVDSEVLRNPPLRQAAKRYTPF